MKFLENLLEEISSVIIHAAGIVPALSRKFRRLTGRTVRSLVLAAGILMSLCFASCSSMESDARKLAEKHFELQMIGRNVGDRSNMYTGKEAAVRDFEAKLMQKYSKHPETKEKFLIILDAEFKRLGMTAKIDVHTQNQTTDFAGTWIDEYESTKLVIRQNVDKISGDIYTTSHGCEWDDPECVEPVTGTIVNGVATITFYSVYQGKNLNAKLKLISNTKMEWTPTQVGNKFTLTKQK